MSDLKLIEKKFFVDIFKMGSGYVLDFSHNSFSEFFRTELNINIEDKKYQFNGTSTAKCLRAFWEIESNLIVGKALHSLLDYWRYCHNSDNAAVQDLYDKGIKIINRLTSVTQNSVKSTIESEKEFLSKEYQEVSLKELDIDEDVIFILESRLKEISNCLIRAPLATIFLCGSTLEGILFGIAKKNLDLFVNTQCASKDEGKNIKPLKEWKLAQLIDVAHELGFLGLDVKKFSHVLRDFRNYIHPYKQLDSKFFPDEYTAKICLQVLKAAINDLQNNRQKISSNAF